MPTVRVDVEPAVPRWALERGGIDLASATTAHPDLEAWLSRTKKPTMKQLERFGQKVHVPFGMLFLSAPPAPAPIPIPDMRTPGSQGVDHPSAELVDVLRECQLRQDWYRDHMLAIGASPVPLVGSATLQNDTEDAGTRLREILHLDALSGAGDAFRSALVGALEEAGVLVMISGYVGNETRRPLNPDEFRGFALADDLAPLIFVNGTEAKTAQHFTLLHETAHLLLGHSALSDARPGRHAPYEEAWCNRVAAAALVPRVVLEQQQERLSTEFDEVVADVAKRCQVSRAVVVLRMKTCGLITPAAADAQLAALARIPHPQTPAPKGGGGDYYRTARYRLGVPFTTAVVASAREGGTSYRDAFRLLGTHKREVMDTLAQKMAAA